MIDNYTDTLSKINQLLIDIVIQRDESLEKVGNIYRQTAEAICKAVILGGNQLPEGDLERQISIAYKLVETRENSRSAQIFRTELRYLQNTGNTFSHVGTPTVPELSKQTAALESLKKVLRIAFFSNGELDPPTLPAELRRDLPVRVLQSDKLENLRPEQVVRIWMPMLAVQTKIQRTEHSTRLLYDYVEATSTNVTFGVLFLRSRSAIEKSLSDCFSVISRDLPESLHIVTPRVYRSSDGRETDRVGTINNMLQQHFSKHQEFTKVVYFDEFVWNNCLPEQIRSAPLSHTPESGVIPQSIQVISGDSKQSQPLMAHEYIDKVLNHSNIHAPVQVVIGPAGIGKTTFCDRMSQHIGAMNRKRVVLLSATDFREVFDPPPIRSVSDLYCLAVDQGFMNENESLDSHTFEINLGCGNFVLIIDGFDELESHLGEALDFESFMHSLADLEASFRKILVILTVRDYDKERFLKLTHTAIIELQGFGEEDTDRYLSQELTGPQIKEAKTLLRSFSTSNNSDNQTVPLYASLIRDHLIEVAQGQQLLTLPLSETAKSFSTNHPLDRLVRKIVDREIAKQSLGNLQADDFFDILIEVIRAPKMGLPKEILAEHVEACGGDAKTVTAINFLRNPFLRFDNDIVYFKYDSLSYFFKSRFLARRFREAMFHPSPAIEFMTELARGEGPLLNELKRIFPASKYGKDISVQNWFRAFHKGLRDNPKDPSWRKALSGFLYWALEGLSDKKERTEAITAIFECNMWECFSIFGKFYPLDLREVQIHDGFIENYSNLASCEFEPGTIVFYETFVGFDDHHLPDKLDRTVFDNSCTYSTNLRDAFEAKEMADELSFEIVRENAYKLLKVGFKANRFIWKSSLVYRKVTVVGRHSRTVYLEKLLTQGVLKEENSKTGPEKGYIVTDEWQSDVRKLIEERNITSSMARLLQALSI
ncbi:NACHT domain-containing protein [Alcaligenes faecalis]|uniref:NACHT domain-containing protein n=1 Tax=Alcaligenes faecalis TaxID=511 RepID=UPI000E18B596|nr:NACHT domain-containing protein [Alcaligenes faecalis]SSY76533.1 NACHT domain [Alcaligenes faecalis subsp. faecalis]